MTISAILMAPLIAVLAVFMAVSFLLTLHRRREILKAGGGGMNFPPGVPPIGAFETFSITGLVAALTTTTVYTCPVSGLYLIGFSSHINSTNKAGSIAATLTTPHAGTVAIATQAGTGTITAIEADPALGGTNPVDGYGAMIPCWMNLGDVVQIAAAVSGLTGTNYSLFTVIGRVL